MCSASFPWGTCGWGGRQLPNAHASPAAIPVQLPRARRSPRAGRAGQLPSAHASPAALPVQLPRARRSPRAGRAGQLPSAHASPAHGPTGLPVQLPRARHSPRANRAGQLPSAQVPMIVCSLEAEVEVAVEASAVSRQPPAAARIKPWSSVTFW